MTAIPLRKPCPDCAGDSGIVLERNGQDTVRCSTCNRYQYNAPRTETGRAARTVQTTHAAIKPKQRARIIMRASARCELCGSRNNLHVGHIISVESGHAFGLDDELINNDENLIAQCDECNLGQGAEPMPLRVAVAVVRARIAWARSR